MEEWKEYKYTDLCTLIGGGTPKTSEPSYWGGHIPWLSVKDFGNDGKYVYSTEKSITDAGLNNSSTKLLKKDDIIISARGTIGAIAMLSSEMAFNQSCFGIRSNTLVDQHYLYYLTKTKIAELQKNSHGSVFDTITRDTFAKLDCLIPPFEKQKAIASILSSFDDKIEVNRRINDNLEQQAQVLFKSWFVDFEPFKDGGFEETEQGLIPKGWKAVSLSSIADYINGLAMQKYRPTDGESGLPVLKIKELGQGRTDDSSELCSPSLIGSKYIIDDGDIIFSWSGTLMVKVWCGGKCGLNQHLFVVEPKDYPHWFAYQWTRHHLDNFIHIAKDKAVTMGHIKRGELDKAKVVVPDGTSMATIDSMMKPLHSQIISNKIESRCLAQLRDTLLPRLMSGELKVNEIENAI